MRVARGGTGGKAPPLAARPTIWTHVLESEELWIHDHHIFSKTGTAFTQNKSGMVAYQSGVYPVSVGIGIILLCVTNTMSSLHLNNASLQTGRVWRRTVDVHTAVLMQHQGVRHFTIDHSHPYTSKARASYVMFARASTTSLACSQSPKLCLMRKLNLLDGLQLQSPDMPLRGVSMILRRNLILHTTRATRREIWCCPARHEDFVPPPFAQ